MRSMVRSHRPSAAALAVTTVMVGLALAVVPEVSGGGLPGLLRLLLVVPVAVTAVAVAAWLSWRVSRPVSAGLAAAGTVFVTASATAVPVAWAAGVSVAEALRQVPVQAAAALLVVSAAALSRWRRPRPIRLIRAVSRPALATMLVGGFLAVPAQPAAAADPAEVAPCVAGQQQRIYSVSAISVDVPFNRFGRTLRNARIFALDQDVAAITNWWRPLAENAADDPAGNRRLRPRPLVLRANEGECVRVTLTNRLSPDPVYGLPAAPRVGIQATGVVLDVRGDGGARAGYNADPTVGIGESTTYFWRVPAQEGLFLFQDMATPAGGEHDAGSRGIGLYGGLAVEPKDSVWTDPRSGAVLSGNGSPSSTYTAAKNQSGELYVEADIHPPGGPSFRESVQLAQDQIPNVGMGFNYGSEPMADREAKACPDCIGEETWLSSWPYGDPALVKLASGKGPWLPKGSGDRKEAEDCGLPESCYVSNVFHTYTGDATKIRFGLSGVKETHVFHLHAHQWLADPRENGANGDGPGTKPASSTLDSQSYGPGEAYTAELLYGAGSQNGTFGDSIFHCHLYPHFAEGYWAIMRVHDVRLDGSTATPDGVNVRPLIPLKGHATPPAATADNPGFPGMIPGTYGFRAPQPPGSVTEGGGDGTPERAAPRLVGGKTIEEAKLAVERAVVARHNGGGAAPRGAPYADPCPDGAREVDYDVTVLQRDLVYNEAGHHDPQARVMVLTKDVPDILAGRKKVEPLFIRANAGDCINFSLTMMAPNWVGGDAFQQIKQTNMAGGHVHLVKFDVTASDGGSNGWNYQQAAFTSEQAALTARQASGEVTCRPSSTFFGGQSTGCRLDERHEWTPPADSRGLRGQTLHERWYADYELRTAFTHDHHFPAVVQHRGHYGALIVEPQGFDVRDPATGEFLQPINNPAHGIPCAASCVGAAVGESVDLIGPGANDDYREYGLAIADFVPLVKKGGDPRNSHDVVNAPGAPEAYPDRDPGTYAINYRNAPLSERSTRDGKPVDPAHKFSSWVFGDPMTPLLQGYTRDNVKLRVVQGSQEEQHLFQVNGLRWREEPDDPDSPLVNAQTIGISEAFNAELPGFDCKNTDTPCRGDYLYGGTSIDDQWRGMWGIMRVHGTLVPGLRALPDNQPTGTAGPAPAPASRQAPPAAQQPGVACPPAAPVRTFDVVALNRGVTYNEHGDNDPKALMYVLAQDEQAVRSGTKKPEPLVIRANAGDCVRLTLRNALPPEYADHRNGVSGDVPQILEPRTGTPMGTRVSMHPQLVRHDVRLSDGAAIGFNPDSTVGIGQTISYEWFADNELGATNIVDYGDVRGHRHHGLAGALVIEPQHATYHDPVTGAEIRSGAAADIRVPGRQDFRESTLIYQDGMDLRTATGAEIKDKPDAEGGAEGEELPEPDGGDVHAGGTEDGGEKGVNYANAPLHRRLGALPGGKATGSTTSGWANVFSSATYGDPATPIIRAYANDQVRVRVLGGNKPRQTGFQLDGALWRQEPYDAQTELVGVQGGIGAGKAVNAHVRLPAVGDHLWSSPTSFALPDGIWGMARVYAKPQADPGFQPSPRKARDNPYTASYWPLMPLERSYAAVRVFDDEDADGKQDAGEPARRGVTVRLLTPAGAEVAAATTAVDGTATFSPAPGSYDVVVEAPSGMAVVGLAKRRLDLSDDTGRAEVAVGLSALATVQALVFDDQDADGVRDSGETGLPGWTVTLDGAATLAPATTGADGAATFTGVTAGGWSADLRPRTGWRATTALPAAVTVGAGDTGVAIGVTRVPGLLVRPVDDANGNAAADDGEPTIGGLVVKLTAGDRIASARTADDGAVVDPAGAAARIQVLRPDSGLPWPCAKALVTTSGGVAVVDCGPDGAVEVPAGASEVVVLGAFTDGVITSTLFDDADRDGRRDAGEAPLADWPVAVVNADEHVEVARTTTDETGTAAAVVPPGRYEIVPMPPVSPIAWVNTDGSYDVEVTRARNTHAAGGWVQPGSVSVGVFHDHDSDGVQEAGEDPLAERTVRLFDSAGQVLATAITDGTGRVAFPVKAGTRYGVDVTVPTGWRATGPVADGAVVVRVPVTAPADGGQASVEVGHYNTVDRTAPQPPTADPGAGALAGPTAVTLTAEAGASIRYTLDGTAPTATRGMLYTAAVRVSMDRVLRAVAIDAAGNVSADLAVAYDLPWAGRTAVLTPSGWAASSGTVRGDAADTTADDGRYLVVASAPVAGRPTADVTAAVPVPADLRSAAALNVSVSLRSSMRNTRVRLQWYDVATNTWRALGNYSQGLDEARVDVDVAAPARAVAADGTVQIRVIGDLGYPFDLSVDQLTVTAVNR
ncbi:SdrD B-like domain-containing protein [Micromonospora avicenniae]|uniref:SdrD B-like domain-containing protein n=1 Tax=Micromonospora avicenniae TaxID=1198245 RepID=UPI003319758A